MSSRPRCNYTYLVTSHSKWTRTCCSYQYMQCFNEYLATCRLQRMIPKTGSMKWFTTGQRQSDPCSLKQVIIDHLITCLWRRHVFGALAGATSRNSYCGVNTQPISSQNPWCHERKGHGVHCIHGIYSVHPKLSDKSERHLVVFVTHSYEKENRRSRLWIRTTPRIFEKI
jgi:hypothetical protein